MRLCLPIADCVTTKQKQMLHVIDVKKVLNFRGQAFKSQCVQKLKVQQSVFVDDKKY